MSVVQHKSAVATATSLEISFNSPVTEGNLLIVAARCGSTSAGLNVTDGANEYSVATNVSEAPSQTFLFSAIAGASGALTITVADASSPVISSEIHVHIFEVSGYANFDIAGTNYQGSVTPDATVSTIGPTQNADDFLVAFFANTFEGVSWTPGSGYSAGETTSGASLTCFSEFCTVSSTGVQTATATQNNGTQILSLIVAFKSGGGPTPTGTPTGGDGKAAYYPRRARAHKPVRSFRRSGA